jgi:hypothetical protein
VAHYRPPTFSVFEPFFWYRPHQWRSPAVSSHLLPSPIGMLTTEWITGKYPWVCPAHCAW